MSAVVVPAVGPAVAPPLRRALIVTPYWPPASSVGVWRVIRLCRYAREHGWEVIVCAPRPGDVFVSPRLGGDEGAAPQVRLCRPRARLRSLTLCRVFAAPEALWVKCFGRRGVGYQALSLLNRGARRVIVNPLLPDQFSEWGRAVTPEVCEWLRREGIEVDVVWGTGGPFGVFTAARLIAQALQRPLALDYRDPWTTSRPPRRGPLAASQGALRALEATALSAAKAVSFINAEALAAAEVSFGRPEGARWEVVPNSADPLDLGEGPARALEVSPPALTLLHAGNFMEGRSCAPLIERLRALPSDVEAKLYVLGQLDRAAVESLQRAPLSSARFERRPPVPPREVAGYMRGVSALVLVIGGGQREALSGKLYDYLAVGRPIIGFGPPDAAARGVIEGAGAGVWVDEGDVGGLERALRLLGRGEVPSLSPEGLAPFHARAMSGALCGLMGWAAGGGQRAQRVW
jgi:hypothetical protein